MNRAIPISATIILLLLLPGCALFGAGGFTLVVTPAIIILVQDGSATVTVELNRSRSFTDAVTISVSDLPAGVTASPLTIGPAEATGDLVLSATPGATTGDSSPVVQGAAGERTETVTLALTVREPGQFQVSVVATGLDIPWDLEFSADGTLYISERGGTVKRLQGGTVTPLLFNPVPAFRVEGEAGLMGMALHPDFSTNYTLYLCYSYSDGSDRNRVSSFVLAGTELTNESVIVDGMPGGGNHNGCRLAFGPDSNLYITMGDAGNTQLSQDENSLAGKVLRVEPDGGIPADNDSGTRLWTLGHRNPQGLAFHPNGRLYSTEHGPASDDEVNLIAEGNNYGWPNVQGTDATPPYTPALVSYTPTLAIAGLDVYEGTLFPGWDGDLLFVSLKAGELHRLELNPDGTVASDEVLIDGDYGRLRDVAVAPDGRIFLATSNRDGRGNPVLDDDRILVLDAN